MHKEPIEKFLPTGHHLLVRGLSGAWISVHKSKDKEAVDKLIIENQEWDSINKPLVNWMYRNVHVSKPNTVPEKTYD